MTQEAFTIKDWHIPFMLFQLSSYGRHKEPEHPGQSTGKELVTDMKNFFDSDNGNEAMEFFWNNVKIGDE